MDPVVTMILSLTALAAIGVLAFASLKGLSAWLDWKRAELGAASPAATALPGTAARIEVADLKERIRKLEAIAAGVEL